MGDQEPDLSHIHWSSPEYINHLPTRTLSTADEALDYFAVSPFWDVKSNNHALRTQRRVFDPLYGSAQERTDLLSFRGGFEYVVSHAVAPRLFLIQRREVEPDGTRKPIDGMFFIMEGKVFAAPSLYEIMKTRLQNASFLLTESFKTLSEARPPSNPRMTTVWRAIAPAAPKPPETSGIQTTTAGTPADVNMEEPEAPIAGLKPTAKTPDWNLLSALNVTRASFAELQDMARRPPAITHREAPEKAKQMSAVSETSQSGRSLLRAGSIMDPSLAATSPAARFAASGRTPSVAGHPSASSPLTMT